MTVTTSGAMGSVRPDAPQVEALLGPARVIEPPPMCREQVAARHDADHGARRRPRHDRQTAHTTDHHEIRGLAQRLIRIDGDGSSLDQRDDAGVAISSREPFGSAW